MRRCPFGVRAPAGSPGGRTSLSAAAPGSRRVRAPRDPAASGACTCPWARRPCRSARRRTPEGFRIQQILRDEPPRAACGRASAARKDWFSLRGRRDASASPRREPGASAQEPGEGVGSRLGSGGSGLRGRTEGSWDGRLCGVHTCPGDPQGGVWLLRQPLLRGIRTNSSGGLRLGSGLRAATGGFVRGTEWWEARTETAGFGG